MRSALSMYPLSMQNNHADPFPLDSSNKKSSWNVFGRHSGLLFFAAGILYKQVSLPIHICRALCGEAVICS